MSSAPVKKNNWLHLYVVEEFACLVNPGSYDSGTLMFLEGSPMPDRLKGRGHTKLSAPSDRMAHVM